MQPINEINTYFCENLTVLFTDIDGTITHNGQIPDDSYSAIWDLARHNIDVVPVTGRPAGWCDHIARMWPVKGVIGENGAFYYRYDRIKKRMIRVYLQREEERKMGEGILKKIEKRVLSEVPGAAISADQPFRISDLAIDYCEDVPPMDKSKVEKICMIAKEEGASYKVSNIHVNCWYGSFNKLNGVRRFIRDCYNVAFEEIKESITFVGDSPNDEPMFHAFPATIAVANIKNFINEITFIPTYVTQKESAFGFREAVNEILRKRVD